MPTLETRTARSTSSFARYAWFVLIYNLGVVLWGAYVRATGSGAGCGAHWPLCDGEVIPIAPTVKKLVEFAHRASTGLDVVFVVLLVVWAFRAYPRGHIVRRGAAMSGVFLLTESLLGAGLVLLRHVAQNADAYWTSMHLVNTLTMLAAFTLTAWFAMGNTLSPLTRREAVSAAVSLGLVMLLGVTGAIAALGDTLFPSVTLISGLRRDFDPQSNLLLRLRGLHPLLAAAVGTWLTVYAVSRLRHATHAALRLIIAVWLQLMAGLVNLLMLAPIGMQLVHLLLADLVWIALVLLCVAPRTVISKVNGPSVR